MKNYEIQLKILSPVHMGTGECYEMFDFVMTPYKMHICDVKNALQEKNHLMLLMEQNKDNPKQLLKNIQIKAFEQADNIYNSDYKKYSVPVSEFIYKEYKEYIDKIRNPEKNKTQDVNQCIIHRTAYNGVNNAPYIPASGVKGAIKTAVFSQQNKKTKNPRWDNILQKNLLGGSFATDPFRVIKASDMHSVTDHTIREIIYIHRINEVENSFKSHLTIQAEVLMPSKNTADYYGTLTLPPYNTSNMSDKAKEIIHIPDLLQTCNSFYKPKFEQYIKTLQHGVFKDKTNHKDLQNILNNMDTNSCIINIGKYGGGVLKTMDGNRKILSRGKRGEPPQTLESPKTVCISGEQKELRNCNELHQMGWAMLTIKQI